MTVVLVTGGRDYPARDHVWSVLDGLRAEGKLRKLYVGDARGADQHAREWADDRSVNVAVFKADWSRHGKAAGPLRNAEMLREAQPSLVVAFPGGRGTADMMRRARAYGVPVLEAGRRQE